MKVLIVGLAALCVGISTSPVEAGGCVVNRAVVRKCAARDVNTVDYAANYGTYNAQFIAIEQPYYLDLVAAQKRQELEAERFQTAVDASVSQRLEGIRAEIEKLRTGDTASTTLKKPGTGPRSEPTPSPAAPPGPQSGDAGTAAAAPAANEVAAFLKAKCAACHTGTKAESGFALFGDDGAPQLSAGKLIQADLMTYSNRMPPKDKLSGDEYSEFRAAYQSWEREIRDAARKSDK